MALGTAERGLLAARNQICCQKPRLLPGLELAWHPARQQPAVGTEIHANIRRASSPVLGSPQGAREEASEVGLGKAPGKSAGASGCRLLPLQEELLRHAGHPGSPPEGQGRTKLSKRQTIPAECAGSFGA